MHAHEINAMKKRFILQGDRQALREYAKKKAVDHSTRRGKTKTSRTRRSSHQVAGRGFLNFIKKVRPRNKREERLTSNRSQKGDFQGTEGKERNNNNGGRGGRKGSDEPLVPLSVGKMGVVKRGGRSS